MPHAPVNPTSLWWSTGEAPPPAPPLVGETTADVVVIGAGIVGVTAARDLALAGLDVVLLESGRVGAGATGHTSAKATALQSPRYARIGSEHGHEAALVHAAATAAAVDRIRDDAARLGSGHAHDEDALTWTDDPDGVDELEAEGRAARAAGLPVADEWHHDRFPLRHGLRLRDQLRFQPLTHLRGLLAEGVAAGLRVHESSPVTDVALHGRRRTVSTAVGSVRTGHVLVATGLPILDRGAWFARMEPEASYVAVLRGGERPAELALRTGEDTRSSRVAHDADGEPLVLVAGAGHRVGHGGDTRERVARLVAWGRGTFGAEEVVATWAAQDWHPADGLPLAGPLVPGDDRVLAAGGFAKWGLTSGTTAAEVLVRRVLGAERTDVDRLYDPARMPGARGVRRLAGTNGTVGLDMVRGWVGATFRRLGPPPAEGEGHVGRDGVRPVAEATVDGDTRRCLAVCPHLGGIVTWEPAQATWGCPLHGSRFDPEGRVVAGPTTRGLAPAGE